MNFTKSHRKIPLKRQDDDMEDNGELKAGIFVTFMRYLVDIDCAT